MPPTAPSTPSPTKTRRSSLDAPVPSPMTPQQQQPQRRGTLTITIKGARNLKAPTPELLGGRTLARPLRDYVVLATPAGGGVPRTWESQSKPALATAPIWNEKVVFEGVPWCVLDWCVWCQPSLCLVRDTPLFD